VLALWTMVDDQNTFRQILAMSSRIGSEINMFRGRVTHDSSNTFELRGHAKGPYDSSLHFKFDLKTRQSSKQSKLTALD
jgi:hypothetical protein